MGFVLDAMTIDVATRFGLYDRAGYCDDGFLGGLIRYPKRNVPIHSVGTCCIVAASLSRSDCDDESCSDTIRTYGIDGYYDACFTDGGWPEPQAEYSPVMSGMSWHLLRRGSRFCPELLCCLQAFWLEDGRRSLSGANEGRLFMSV